MGRSATKKKKYIYIYICIFILSVTEKSIQQHDSEHTAIVSEPVNHGYGAVCSYKVTDTMVLKGTRRTSGLLFEFRNTKLF